MIKSGCSRDLGTIGWTGFGGDLALIMVLGSDGGLDMIGATLTTGGFALAVTLDSGIAFGNSLSDDDDLMRATCDFGANFGVTIVGGVTFGNDFDFLASSLSSVDDLDTRGSDDFFFTTGSADFGVDLPIIIFGGDIFVSDGDFLASTLDSVDDLATKVSDDLFMTTGDFGGDTVGGFESAVLFDSDDDLISRFDPDGVLPTMVGITLAMGLRSDDDLVNPILGSDGFLGNKAPEDDFRAAIISDFEPDLPTGGGDEIFDNDFDFLAPSLDSLDFFLVTGAPRAFGDNLPPTFDCDDVLTNVSDFVLGEDGGVFSTGGFTVPTLVADFGLDGVGEGFGDNLPEIGEVILVFEDDFDDE